IVEGGGLPGVPAGDPTLAHAAALLSVLQTPPPRLSAAARVRIAARLAEGEAAPVVVSHRVNWAAVVAAALVLFAGGAVGAAWGVGTAQKWLEHHFPGRLSKHASRPQA